MYRQILVDMRDVDYQRILWKDPTEDEITDFQLLTVTYGTASAPYLALRVLKQLAHDEGAEFPLATSILTSNIYVDDCVFGAEDKPLALQTRDQLIRLLGKAGFRLRKWATDCNSSVDRAMTGGVALRTPRIFGRVNGRKWSDCLPPHHYARRNCEKLLDSRQIKSSSAQTVEHSAVGVDRCPLSSQMCQRRPRLASIPTYSVSLLDGFFCHAYVDTASSFKMENLRRQSSLRHTEEDSECHLASCTILLKSGGPRLSRYLSRSLVTQLLVVDRTRMVKIVSGSMANDYPFAAR
ncbi:hypothetical protein RF55_12434 [Lasius niger]|uniref:Reverse transcriptase domain-containing protein n=1 Tax=Lasius niger TaxID=67767 RepID=A0A0J7KD50_LASNI|nr:hypothetical protein RF55_12434 [Lasius niger]